MKTITTMVFNIIVRYGTSLFMGWAAPVFCCRYPALGPAIDKWQASWSNDAQFTGSSFFPLNLWQTYAWLYYTVRDPGLSERIHAQIFSETYYRHNPLSDNGQMAAFLLRNKHAHDR